MATSAQIIMSDSDGLRPGYRPMTVIKDKAKARSFRLHSKRGTLKADELETLRGEAYGVKANAQGFIEMRNNRGLTTLSLLRKDEWEELDRTVIDAVTQELNAVQALRDAGLVQRLGGLGTMVTQFNVASEKHEASVSMSGRAAGLRDRTEKIIRTIPVPITHSEYEIGVRELDASRRLGDALDAQEARSSAIVVGEKIEETLFDGDSSIEVSGNTIFGLTNHAGRDTDTAANYGGGDWGTAGNPVATVLGMLSALKVLNYRGPFGVFAANTQYFEALTPNANRAGSDFVDILAIPSVNFMLPSDFLTAAEVIVVQLTRDVVDIAVALETTNREWSSGDEMAFYGKVLASIVPRVKQDHAGNVGVAHATSA